VGKEEIALDFISSPSNMIPTPWKAWPAFTLKVSADKVVFENQKENVSIGFPTYRK